MSRATSELLPCPPPARVPPLVLACFALALAAVAFRCWTSLCFFPFADWNDVRLAPTFMLWHGPTPYPGLTDGPLTTWTYGPVPLLFNLPALLAGNAAGALLIAGAINLLAALVPAALAIFALPPATDAHAPSATHRLGALLLCLALWPNSSLHYFQSDNAATAFGLLSCALLLRAPERHSTLRILAALGAALAVWSKQTSLGLIPAQLLWLGLTAGPATSLRYALTCAAFGLALGGVFAAWFGFDGLWLNVVGLPARFPVTANFVERTGEFPLHLAGYVLLPVIAVTIARRTIFRRDSIWLLPTLVWLVLLPTGLISFYKIGGSANSLHGVLYLFPVATVGAVGWLHHRKPHAAHAWLAATVLLVTARQVTFAPLIPLQPLTAHLETGAILARKFPGQIYFPWNPLLTFFSEHRFYHVEDALTVRHVSGSARSSAAILRDLPPTWFVTALPGWRDYGIYKKLQPPSAQLGFFGSWSVYTWPPPSPPKSAVPILAAPP